MYTIACAGELCEMNYEVLKKNDRHFLSLTSLHIAEFLHLHQYFAPICESYYKWHTIDGKKRKLPRLKANAKERLPSSEEKLFFLLVYLKNNPLQTFQAASFGVSQSQVSNLTKALNALLSRTLKAMGLQPATNNEALQSYLEKHQVKDLYQDVTEREIARKTDIEAQKEDYSGKKKEHTVKNSVICGKNQYIYYVSPSYEGKQHDKSIADEEALLFPKGTQMWCDLAYLGYESKNLTLFLPHKKPKNQELTDQQKQHNTQHAKERICNEHAMRGIKRLRIVQDPLRLCPYQWADNLFNNACALHNFRIRSPLRAYAHAHTHVKKLNFN